MSGIKPAISYDKYQFFDHAKLAILAIEASACLRDEQNEIVNAELVKLDTSCRLHVTKDLLGRKKVKKRDAAEFIAQEFLNLKAKFGIDFAINVCCLILESYRVPESYIAGNMRKSFNDFDKSHKPDRVFQAILRGLGLARRLD